MSTAPVDWAAVAPPSSMQTARRWLLCALEQRTKPDGSSTTAKVPYYTTGERRRGDLGNDAGRLVTFAEAIAARALWGDRFALLGFALGEGWQGIDFDHCDTRPELAALVGSLPGYVEVSPSKCGVHAIGYGQRFDSLGSNASGIEAYCEGRFFTFTGWQLRPGDPVDLCQFVADVCIPRHAAHRRVGAIEVRPAVAPTGERTIDELADALRHLDPDDRDTWVNVGQALRSLDEAGYALWAAWSATSTRFPGGDDLDRWDTFSGERTGYASIFNKAAANGWKNPAKIDPAAIFAGSSLVSLPAPGAMPLPPGMPVMPLPPGGIPAVPTTAPVGRLDGQEHRDTGGGRKEAAIQNVVDAIGPTSGVQVAFDEFQQLTLIATPAGAWRPITDLDYFQMRELLGRSGFKPVSAEIMHAGVALQANLNKIDSARDWVNSLPAWDGVSRIEGAMHRYYGCEDNPYSRAVGAYLFTALAGRALSPGIQADMAIILVGLQGARKTSAVAALAPSVEAFGEVNLSKTDEQIAYVLRGKLVVEIAEMRGFAGRDAEAKKAWVSRRVEEWREPYQRTTTKYPRRAICLGTANDSEQLDDPTGERRFLPIMSGTTDVDAIIADRDQLWAEGAALYRQSGVAWRDAERLAKAVHADFKISDSWAEIIAHWLESVPITMLGEIPSPYPKNNAGPFALHQVAEKALGIRRGDITRREEIRIGKVLRGLGYEKVDQRIGQLNLKRWLPSVALQK